MSMPMDFEKMHEMILENPTKMKIFIDDTFLEEINKECFCGQIGKNEHHIEKNDSKSIGKYKGIEVFKISSIGIENEHHI